MTAVLMGIEGVLADDLDPSTGLVNSQPLPNGLRLFHAIRTQFQVVLSTKGDLAVANGFLRAAGIRPEHYALLLDGGERITHLRSARRVGYRIEFIIDADPNVAVAALRQNVTPLCCPHPAYARTAFLPDAGQGKLAWAEIQTEVLGQRAARQVDERAPLREVSFDDV